MRMPTTMAVDGISLQLDLYLTQRVNSCPMSNTYSVGMTHSSLQSKWFYLLHYKKKTMGRFALSNPWVWDNNLAIACLCSFIHCDTERQSQLTQELQWRPGWPFQMYVNENYTITEPLFNLLYVVFTFNNLYRHQKLTRENTSPSDQSQSLWSFCSHFNGLRA